jgi:hypothetical protein
VPRARLLLLFVLLLGLDLSCPLVPGALAFNADDSVEGPTSSARLLTHTVRILAHGGRADHVAVTEPPRATLSRVAGVVVAVAHRGRSSTAAPPEPSHSLSEDH